MVLSAPVRLRARWGALGLTIASLAWGDAGDAHDLRKRMQAVRAARAPRIDGKLGADECWREAPLHEDFLERVPKPGAPPSERTSVQVCYDDEALYVGVRAWDREPDKIVARLARRDRNVESDMIEVHIDSRHDHNTGAAFFLTAAGSQLDAFVSNDGDFSFDWDAVWDGRARRDAEGWTAELSIPLSALRFAEAEEYEWGVQISRYIARNREMIAWSTTPRDRKAFMSSLAHLSGIRGIRPRRTFELRPFAALRLETFDEGGSFLGAGGGDADVDPGITGGLDLKLGLTRGLTLDATILPDFGQIEADEVVLNLSRFETFFPEKRPFFLEGADVFATPISLFYSRRIGRGKQVPDVVDGAELLEGGGSVPIVGAAKVTGAIGKLGVAALAAVTASETATYQAPVEKARISPFQGFGVLRMRRSFGGASYLGAMATAAVRLGEGGRVARRNHDAYSQAIDGALVAFGGKLRMAAQIALTERVDGERGENDEGAPCAEGDVGCRLIARSDGTLREANELGVGAILQLSYTSNHVDAGGTFTASSRRFDTDDLGFYPEYGTLKADFGASWRDLVADDFRTYLSAGGGTTLIATTDGTPYEAAVGGEVNVDLLSGGYLHLELGFRVPGLFDPYETGDGARLERHSAVGSNAEWSTDRRGMFGGRLFVDGEFAFQDAAYSGRVEGELVFVPTAALELSLTPKIGWSGNQTRFYTPDGGCLDDAGAACSPLTETRHYRFADLTSAFFALTLRASYMFTPRLSLIGYAQLFLARGEFSDYRTIDTFGTRPKVRLDDLQPELGFAGDTDGDGQKDDDFQDGSLNVNLVLRWELKPGSTLQVVYAREQLGAAELLGQRPRLELRGLGAGSATDLFLVKLSWLFT
jgi:hypothetical protein